MRALTSAPAWRRRSTGPLTAAVARAGAWPTVAGLAGLLPLSLVLRTRELSGPLWIDEAISAGVVAHPLTDIPGLLERDGSPPLYYLLLHLWADLAGDGEAALRIPSLVAALAAIPAAYWVGRRLFDARAGWLAAVAAALLPFLTDHAQEARMYALVALLALLAAGAFVLAAAGGGLRPALALGVLLTLLLYTHNWALFLVVGLAAALPFALVPGRRRAGLRDVALALAGAGLAYAPWVPTLVSQAGHTGAPWASRPPWTALVAALAVGAAAPLVARLGRTAGERRALAALGMLGAATLATAVAAGHVERLWAGRYLAVVVGPLILAGAAALARLGKAGLVAALGLAILWSLHGAPGLKSNVAAATAAVADRVGAGDLVISTQPEQVPAIARYLPSGPAFATPMGPVEDVGVPDWRDALDRLRAATPAATLEPLVAALPAGAHLLLATPTPAESARRSTPWTDLVALRSAEWRDALDEDPRLVAQPVTPPAESGSRTDVVLHLYVKAGAPARDPTRMSP